MTEPKAMSNSVHPSYTARASEAVHIFRTGQLDFGVGNGRLTIACDDPVFIDAVARDIGQLVHRPEGDATLRRGDALGHPVRIIKPDPATEPPNAWITPDDIGAASSTDALVGKAEGGAIRGTGAGCGSMIVYSPADWPRPGDPASPDSVEVLLIALRQANTNAEGRSDPSASDWGSRA
jgi:hypothetical protein